MALSVTGSGVGSGGGGGGNDGDDRRYKPSLPGILKFCTDQTDEDRDSVPRETMSDEKDVAISGSESKKDALAISGSESNKDSIKYQDVSSEKSPLATPSDDKNESFFSSMEQARHDQDKALNTLGLYRFKIPGDGNCMFRAVASQLHIKQEDVHTKLRRKAVEWMKENAEQLLAGGLLDSLDEIAETSKVGVWPSQAALVAMANVLEINIAVIQGGDKGNIDIQHVTPFDTPVNKDCSEGIILAYLYNGHYDGIVHDPKTPNPEYKQWLLDQDAETKRGERLARGIERYGSSYGRTRSSSRERKPENDPEFDLKYKAAVPRNDEDFNLYPKSVISGRKTPEIDSDRLRVRVYDENIDSLTSRTQDLTLRKPLRSPVAENVKPSLSVHETLTGIPVTHARGAPDPWRSSDSGFSTISHTREPPANPYYSQPTGYDNLDAKHRHRMRVIPIQHERSSVGAIYEPKDSRYRDYFMDPRRRLSQSYPYDYEPASYSRQIYPASSSSVLETHDPPYSKTQYTRQLYPSSTYGVLETHSDRLPRKTSYLDDRAGYRADPLVSNPSSHSLSGHRYVSGVSIPIQPVTRTQPDPVDTLYSQMARSSESYDGSRYPATRSHHDYKPSMSSQSKPGYHTGSNLSGGHRFSDSTPDRYNTPTSRVIPIQRTYGTAREIPNFDFEERRGGDTYECLSSFRTMTPAEIQLRIKHHNLY